jgi:hypothetical protein
LAKPPVGIRFEVFRDALLGAGVDGQHPSRSCDLGREARSIIEDIAERHPEANPDSIADAYDAIDRETNSGDGRFRGPSTSYPVRTGRE